MNFDEFAKRKPINKLAFDVASSGEHFSFGQQRLGVVHSDIPLPITTRCIPSEEDFTGRVIGRLTVIGRSDEPVDERWPHTRWVVRCACGWYERRRSRVLRTIPPEDQMCSSCKLLEQRKAGYGPWMRDEEIQKKSASVITAPVRPVRTVDVEIKQHTYNKPRRLPRQAIPADLRWRVWERDNFTCLHCGTRKHLSIDHIIPESQGGLTIIENLQTLCVRCNSKKGVS